MAFKTLSDIWQWTVDGELVAFDIKRNEEGNAKNMVPMGVGKEKISLYKGQDIIKANLQSGEAVDSLIQLIKDNGDWVDPPS